MILARYPTDLTDSQWGVLAPLIPAAKTGGRPRTTDVCGECCLLRPAGRNTASSSSGCSSFTVFTLLLQQADPHGDVKPVQPELAVRMQIRLLGCAHCHRHRRERPPIGFPHALRFHQLPFRLAVGQKASTRYTYFGTLIRKVDPCSMLLKINRLRRNPSRGEP